MKKILVRQDGMKDCGPACLQMILKYHDGYDSIENLRIISGTGKEGTTAFELLRAGEKLGFKTKAVKGTWDDLDNSLLPAIAHVTIDKTYDHFIVINKIDKDKELIYINDPAKGSYKLDYDEFDAVWNKVLLLFFPSKYIINNKTNYLKLSSLIKPHTKTILIIIFMSLLYILLSIGTSLYFKYLIDVVINRHSYKLLVSLSIIILCIYMCKNFISFFRNKIIIHLNNLIDFKLIKDIISKIVSLPYHYYKSRTTGEILSRVTDVRQIKELLSRVILSLFIDSIIVILVFVVLLLISVKMTIVSLVICLLYLILLIIYYRRNDDRIIKTKEEEASFNSYLVETVSTYETVKGLHIEKETINKNMNNYHNYIQRFKKLEKSYNLQELFKNIIGALGIVLILFTGTQEVLNGAISVGDLITYNTIVLYFLEPIRGLIDLEPLMKTAKASLKRINDLYVIKGEDIAKTTDKVKGDITFNNLNYSYNGYQNVLNNIHLHIKYGEKIMFLGESASGKSTLFKLLLKYHEVDKGKIFIDNNDIEVISTKVIRNSMVYISQNELLYTDTILNNLMLNRYVNEEKIYEVCHLAKIDELIRSKRLGINYYLEENGFNISGGEKQRVVLGRSLLKDFNYLIIDESTGELDTRMERHILVNLINEFKDKTIIVISHRENNSDLFDRTIRMEKGQILE